VPAAAAAAAAAAAEAARLADGCLERAQHYYARAINADPTAGSPWRAWADLERHRGREGRARFCHRRAAELDNRRDFGAGSPDYPLARPWTWRKLSEWI